MGDRKHLTEAEHMDRAEDLAAAADSAWKRGGAKAQLEAEVAARLAEMHFVAAAVHALTAEPLASPRTQPPRASGFPNLRGNDMRGRRM